MCLNGHLYASTPESPCPECLNKKGFWIKKINKNRKANFIFKKKCKILEMLEWIESWTKTCKIIYFLKKKLNCNVALNRCRIRFTQFDGVAKVGHPIHAVVEVKIATIIKHRGIYVVFHGYEQACWKNVLFFFFGFWFLFENRQQTKRLTEKNSMRKDIIRHEVLLTVANANVLMFF